MAVDLESIARSRRCDISSLRIALPLLEQGYSPPFLARYRRDELSGLDESTLWALASSVRAEQAIAQSKQALNEQWEKTPLADPALGQSIKKSNSKRVLDRLSRRLKQEPSDPMPSEHLAVRVLNPRKGDGDDLAELAGKVEAITDPDGAVAGIDEAIAKRLVGDPRVLSAAIRWLAKNARIHIAKISDPHTSEDSQAKDDKPAAASPAKTPAEAETPAEAKTPAEAQTPAVADGTEKPAASTEAADASSTETPNAEVSTEGAEVAEATATPDAAAPLASAPETEAAPTTSPADATSSDATSADATSADATSEEATGAEETAESAAAPSVDQSKTVETSAVPKEKSAKAGSGEKKKAKKISPRQRRRRWLVSVLNPLAGKRLPASKLSSFQIVMLGRALRSQVAECLFEYDAAKLVAEMQRVAISVNRTMESKLRELVLEHEASIREAAEAAWWDEMHEKASVRLIGITADNLRNQINRGSVDGQVVMAIDAVGPRTAATAIVGADGSVMHCEDLPCQLSAAQRTQAVSKMGELIHAHNVDLIVISTGPARRACLIALGELIAQSTESTLRWTIADRSGADAYANGEISNQEMRSTPRRFRAAAWLALSVLKPADAIIKVDPLKLRLASFQRELSDNAMKSILSNVMVSAASRSGVDVNRASVATLARLPGMSESVAQAIDAHRRANLFSSREEISDLDDWQTVVESRQSLPFLRVFGSDEVLDGTLIHPSDYALAKKLAKSLEIELPPAAPPAYVPADYSADVAAEEAIALKEQAALSAAPVVEDLSKVIVNNESFGEGAGAADGSDSNEAAEASQTAEKPSGESTDADVAVAESSESEVADSETTSPAETPQAEETPEAAAATETTEATESAESESAESSDASTDGAPAETTDATASAESTEQPETAVATQTPAAEPVPEVKRPRPEQAKIDKCVKEWQVGKNRVHQVVNWLCDPFGDAVAVSGQSQAVMTSMPTQAALKAGDCVVGVVVGVMPFGAFVEIAPDCSGLIHVSKVTDRFVEDLHEVVQVGDVVTAWVTGIDEKKRRVALSAISPEREAELAEQRKESRDSRGGNRSRGRGRDDRDSRGASNSSGGGQRGGGARGTGQSRGGGGPSRGGGKPRDGGRGKGGQRGGRPGSRDSRGGRGRRERKPESYNVVGKKEESKISDAMKTGDEPLRSFGDLMQFYSKDEAPKEVKSKKPAKSEKPQTEKPKSDATESSPVSEQSVSSDTATPVDADSGAPADAKVVVEDSSEIKLPASDATDSEKSSAPESASDSSSSQE